MINDKILSIVDLNSKQLAEIANSVTSLEVSYTMDFASEISFSVLDPDFKMLKNNYFQIRRQVNYRNTLFEISAVDVDRSEGGSPLIKISARTAVLQQMKRDKQPETFANVSATQYADIVASRFNLKLFAESTVKRQSIIKAKNANSDESTWTVLKRLADDLQFVCFESSGTLFFCSQQFLLGKIGVDPVPPTLVSTTKFEYPGVPVKRPDRNDSVKTVQQRLLDLGYKFAGGADGFFGPVTEGIVKQYQRENGLVQDGIVGPATWSKLFTSDPTGASTQGTKYIPFEWPKTEKGNRFILLDQPKFRRSDDDPLQGDGSLTVDRKNGTQLRPGQTVGIKGVPTFEGLYLITECRFSEASPDPVGISFRTPEKPDPEKLKAR
jgi:hypothetical protein